MSIPPSLLKTFSPPLLPLCPDVWPSSSSSRGRSEREDLGAKWWRSPAWTGMLTLDPSPSAEAHLFDLRCDCVFSSPHLQLPLNHVPRPTQPPAPSSSGLSGRSLINCFNLEKHPSSCYCFFLVCYIFCRCSFRADLRGGRAAVSKQSLRKCFNPMKS